MKCANSVSSGLAEFQVAQPFRTQNITRVFVVGCGHSGTSLLLRTIGNFKGVMALNNETNVLGKFSGNLLKRKLSLWDELAERGNYSHWVEKTPKVSEPQHLKQKRQFVAP